MRWRKLCRATSARRCASSSRPLPRALRRPLRPDNGPPSKSWIPHDSRSKPIRSCRGCGNASAARSCRRACGQSSNLFHGARMAGFNNLMKQAAAMQANLQKAQAEVLNIEVEGVAGGGMVKVTMTGRHEVKRVQLEPSVVSEDREMLEDLIAAAINDAVHKVEARVQEKMSTVMAGMQLPPGFKLPGM